MKCANCGAELKVGCIYCSVCGQEAQIVPDYSLLEDDLLRELLQEDKGKKGRKHKSDGAKKHNSDAAQKPGSNGKKKKKQAAIIISIIAIVVAVLAVFLTIWLVQKKRENSYSYQYEKGEEWLAEGNYVKAGDFFKRALALDDTSIEVRFQLVEVALKLEEADEAIHMLREIIELDASNVKAYVQLVELYRQRENIPAIQKLKEAYKGKDEKILGLFLEFEVEEPQFSMEPGTYSEYITVELKAEEGCEIYYTLDDSSPAENGELYQEPFRLETQDELRIRAVAKDTYGICSEEITGTFRVKFKKPKMPVVLPDGGSYTEPVSISVVVPEGAKVYYTWDGSTPTTDSYEYTGPFEAIEGNNILSLILVDKYGMTSNVMKCNFKYMP